MDDKLKKLYSFVTLCPTCQIPALDPDNCLTCGTPIPPYTTIRVTGPGGALYEITGYHNAERKTFSILEAILSIERAQRNIYPRPQQSISNCHDENYAAEKYRKTDEEIQQEGLPSKRQKLNEYKSQSEEEIPIELDSNVEAATNNLVTSQAEEKTSCTLEVNMEDSNFRAATVRVKSVTGIVEDNESVQDNSESVENYPSSGEGDANVILRVNNSFGLEEVNNIVGLESTTDIIQNATSTEEKAVKTFVGTVTTSISTINTSVGTFENSVNKPKSPPATLETACSSSALSTSNVVRPTFDFIPIYDSDLARLQNNRWLNDSVIDSYLRFVYHCVIPPKFRELTHIFSSCFHASLQKMEDDPEEFKKLHKLVKRSNVFSKDYIFFPVNRRKHWFLVVVCFLAEACENQQSKGTCIPNLFDERTSQDGKKEHPFFQARSTSIFFLDSLKDYSVTEEKMKIASSFEKLVKLVREDENPDKPSIGKPITVCIPQCPQQVNQSDCGLYTLQFVESFFQVPLASLEDPLKDLSNWFPQSIMENKRNEVFTVLSSMVVPRPPSPDSSDSDIQVLPC